MVPERAFLLESELFYRCFSRVLLKAQNSCCFPKHLFVIATINFIMKVEFQISKKKDMNVANSN